MAAADVHLTCLARATEEGPPVPYVHLMGEIDPRHAPDSDRS